MANRVVHFEIQAENPERASAFYKDVFGWDIQPWKGPEGNQARYWLIMTGKGGSTVPGKEGQGIDGGMIQRRTSSPELGAPVNAYVCVVEVEALADTVRKIEKAGGKIALPPMAMQGVGLVAYGLDTEGNLFGMIEPAPKQ